mmetsp:Transcript_69116/g.154182  ORF Transcript_69116/g.154182 Transcript_69116/m.154182 type:complete len:134 (+) Transcript_69116:744-1145(+)
MYSLSHRLCAAHSRGEGWIPRRGTHRAVRDGSRVGHDNDDDHTGRHTHRMCTWLARHTVHWYSLSGTVSLNVRSAATTAIICGVRHGWSWQRLLPGHYVCEYGIGGGGGGGGSAEHCCYWCGGGSTITAAAFQ